MSGPLVLSPEQARAVVGPRREAISGPLMDVLSSGLNRAVGDHRAARFVPADSADAWPVGKDIDVREREGFGFSGCDECDDGCDVYWCCVGRRGGGSVVDWDHLCERHRDHQGFHDCSGCCPKCGGADLVGRVRLGEPVEVFHAGDFLWVEPERFLVVEDEASMLVEESRFDEFEQTADITHPHLGLWTFEDGFWRPNSWAFPIVWREATT